MAEGIVIDGIYIEEVQHNYSSFKFGSRGFYNVTQVLF